MLYFNTNMFFIGCDIKV